jgi:molecular chaperone DnaK
MVNVHVAQGEREMIDNNKTLSRFELTGLPPAPRGVPQIDVSFEIDANGILNVVAKDLGTGREQTVRVVSNSGLDEGEIKEMIRNAERHREEDAVRKDIASERNELEGLLYTTERSLDEFGDAVAFEDLMAIREAITKAQAALKSSSVDVLLTARTNLGEAAQAIADALYAGSMVEAESMASAMEADGAVGDKGEAP